MEAEQLEFRVFKRRLSLDDILSEIHRRWCTVCYLIINWRIDQLREYGKLQIPKEFLKEVAKHLYAYVYENQMPPEPIAGIILNMADDFVRGEQVRIRTGDYIALENYRRSLG